MIALEIHRDLDLNVGVYQEPIREAFVMGDQRAHRFVINLKRGRNGETIDLTGTKVTGYFVRSDKITVINEGSVEENRAIIQLRPECYEVPGRFSFAIKLVRADTVVTIAFFMGSISRVFTADMLDPT